MFTVKSMAERKALFMDSIEGTLAIPNYVFIGRSKEGLIYETEVEGEVAYVEVKAVAKKIDFDAQDAMDELAEAQKVAFEKKQKQEQKVASAKAKKAKKEEGEGVVLAPDVKFQ
jgi:hypothetical protein